MAKKQLYTPRPARMALRIDGVHMFYARRAIFSLAPKNTDPMPGHDDVPGHWVGFVFPPTSVRNLEITKDT